LSQKNLNRKLKLLFKGLGIKNNDKIIIHSNIAGLSQYHEGGRNRSCKIFISFLKKYIGKKGIIIIPTYNYQFTKYKKIDLKKAPSEVGFFSNYLLIKNWKKRTLDPVFSHIIFGKIMNFNLKNINSEAFGKDSVFNFFTKYKFKIICFCCSTDRITFLHYIEYLLKVPYRYIKKFSGILVNCNSKIKINYKYNVGKKNYDYSLKEKKINKLIDQKNFVKKYFGRFECYSVSSTYLYNAVKKKVKINKKFLID
jgi:aminoglycoside 3-N-acetyltransferase